MVRPSGATRAMNAPMDSAPVLRYVRWNELALLGGVGYIAVMAAILPLSVPYFVMSLYLMVVSPILIYAGVLARTERAVAAVLAVAIFNWIAVAGVSAIVPFAVMVTQLTLILPTLLAAPYLRPGQLAALQTATVTATAAAAVTAALSPGIGVEELTPRWALDIAALFFLPATAGLALLVAWQSHQILARRRDDLARSRDRLSRAAAGQRQRIERALNRGPGLLLGNVHDKIEKAGTLAESDRPGAADLLGQVATELQEASVELRDMAHGIFPGELTEHGLAAALKTLALTTPIPVEVAVEGVGRYPPVVDTSVYFCCAQAVDNVRRYAGPEARATITLDGTGGGLSFTVEDTGAGCEPEQLRAGEGIAAMADRLHAIGGLLDVDGFPGEGVRIHGNVPVDAITTADEQPQPREPAAVHALAQAWTVLARLVGGGPPRGQDHHIEQGLRIQLLPTGASAIAVTAAYSVVRDGWLLVVAAVAAVAVVLLLVARRADHDGHRDRALLIQITACWAFAIAITVLAPFTVLYTAVIIAVPIVLAVPYLRDSFNFVIMGTVLAAIVIACCGRFSPGVGFDTLFPRWMVDGQNVVFLLVAATQFMYMVSLSHAAMIRNAELLRSSRIRVVATADAERQRIERDLHDGAQQRLVSSAIQARVAQRQLRTTTTPPAAVLAALSKELQATAADLQNLCRGIYPAELTENGLAAALHSLAARSPVPTAVTTAAEGRRLPADVEITIYFCCVESLQNCIKHAGAGVTVTITITESPGTIAFTVADDGPGAEPRVLSSGRGFTGMSDRLTAIGGALRARSAPGRGVAIEGCVPLAARLDG